VRTLEELQGAWERASSRTKLEAWAAAGRWERAVFSSWITQLGPYDLEQLTLDVRALQAEHDRRSDFAGLVEPA